MIDSRTMKMPFYRTYAPILCSTVLLLVHSCSSAGEPLPLSVDAQNVERDIDTCGIEPTLDALQDEVFLPHCSFGSCHGNAPGKGNLMLTPEAAYDHLLRPTDNPAASRTARVVAGAPDASFLLSKMTGQLGSDEGDLMPKGRPIPLDDCKINLVRAWIKAGALNN
ncbi:MAG: hypothetical protein VX223_06665 [Myxococcota bacterium]|nr:hypothetical protein [Myxococcota bacterium]